MSCKPEAWRVTLFGLEQPQIFSGLQIPIQLLARIFFRLKASLISDSSNVIVVIHKVHSLLDKGLIEKASPTVQIKWFYSTYFLGQKSQGFWLKFWECWPCWTDFSFAIAPCHGCFLRFAFQGQASQVTSKGSKGGLQQYWCFHNVCLSSLNLYLTYWCFRNISQHQNRPFNSLA